MTGPPLPPAKGKGAAKVLNVGNLSSQEAWLTSRDSESPIEFDTESLNPHYAYEDEQNRRHDVWMLDGVTALNQMRARAYLGLNTFALWRLGSEDRSLWTVWDNPTTTESAKLADMPPGQDVDYEGEGEIIRVTGTPEDGRRAVTEDPQTQLITQEKIESTPDSLSGHAVWSGEEADRASPSTTDPTRAGRRRSSTCLSGRT